jgi:hypothetical protein
MCTYENKGYNAKVVKKGYNPKKIGQSKEGYNPKKIPIKPDKKK